MAVQYYVRVLKALDGCSAYVWQCAHQGAGSDGGLGEGCRDPVPLFWGREAQKNMF